MDVPTIWVISPDPETRRLIALNLTKRGFRVWETSPQDGMLPSGAEPQLIILDMDPSDESGWETASALRQSTGLRETPMILLLTAAPRPRRLGPLQPVRWLEKPLAMDAVLDLVRRSLGQQGT